MNKTYKALKVLVIVLMVFVIAVSGLLIWQNENISALVFSVIYEEEQLNAMVGEAHQEIRDVMTSDDLVAPREPTEEENKALTSGEITVDEFKMILTGQTTLEQIREKKNETKPDETKPDETKPDETKQNEQKPVEQKPNEQKPNEQKPNEQKPNEQKPVEQKPDEQKPKDYETLISEKVAEMYAIKANYYSEFNAYWAKAKADFLARPVEEHTQENVAAVVKDKMDEGLAMEKRYDAQIEVVLSELTELLKAAGKNIDLVDTIRNAYVAEKKAEKARIMKKYFN